MAEIERLIPHLLEWESGVRMKAGESLERAYERARAKGAVTLKGDSGGATVCGVTIGTFRGWRKRQGKGEPGVDELEKLSYSEWKEILKALFWDPCKGDMIRNQSVADMLVDWRWVNGSAAVRDAQEMLSLVPDGIVGPKTLAALNAEPSATTFLRLKAARERSYRGIAERSPLKRRFLKGWLNRTDSIKYEEG